MSFLWDFFSWLDVLRSPSQASVRAAAAFVRQPGPLSACGVFPDMCLLLAAMQAGPNSKMGRSVDAPDYPPECAKCHQCQASQISTLSCFWPGPAIYTTIGNTRPLTFVGPAGRSGEAPPVECPPLFSLLIPLAGHWYSAPRSALVCRSMRSIRLSL